MSTPTDRTPLRTWCTELEVAGALPAYLATPPGARYDEARVLLRLHGEPLGYASAPVGPEGVDVPGLLSRVSTSALDRARVHLEQESLPAASPLTLAGMPGATASCPSTVAEDVFVTVAVCTRERPESLRTCLDALTRLSYANLEILVVDNAPASDATRSVVSEVAATAGRVRYVVEPRPGLSRARNRAVREARGDVLAFTDDDVSVDPGWVSGIVRGFQRRPDVGCVTGLVCTASIEGEAEAYFDSRVSWAADRSATVYDIRGTGADTPLFPYAPGLFGTGANLALRLDALREVGDFDELLGAGTTTKGGEDLDMFVRVLQAGYSLAYEPSALVWHHHRAEMAGLQRQMFGYGSGLSAFYAKHLVDVRTRGEVLRRLPRGLARLLSISRSAREVTPAGARPPAGLLARELLGMAAGPALYWRARRTTSRALA